MQTNAYGNEVGGTSVRLYEAKWPWKLVSLRLSNNITIYYEWHIYIQLMSTDSDDDVSELEIQLLPTFLTISTIKVFKVCRSLKHIISNIYYNVYLPTV